MGKRKSRAKPPPEKPVDRLDTVFCCPFCDHGCSVECRIDMKNLIGEAVCRICQESFSTTVTVLGYLGGFFAYYTTIYCAFSAVLYSWCITMFLLSVILCILLISLLSSLFAPLTEPIDIYTEWIDECEWVNNLEDDVA